MGWKAEKELLLSCSPMGPARPPHQLALVPCLSHTDVLVTLHGDIGKGDGILLHPQALELQREEVGRK